MAKACGTKREKEDDREQKRLRDGEREEWKATIQGSEEEMKGYVKEHGADGAKRKKVE